MPLDRSAPSVLAMAHIVPTTRRSPECYIATAVRCTQPFVSKVAFGKLGGVISRKKRKLRSGKSRSDGVPISSNVRFRMKCQIACKPVTYEVGKKKSVCSLEDCITVAGVARCRNEGRYRFWMTRISPHAPGRVSGCARLVECFRQSVLLMIVESVGVQVRESRTPCHHPDGIGPIARSLEEGGRRTSGTTRPKFIRDR